LKIGFLAAIVDMGLIVNAAPIFGESSAGASMRLPSIASASAFKL